MSIYHILLLPATVVMLRGIEGIVRESVQLMHWQT